MTKDELQQEIKKTALELRSLPSFRDASAKRLRGRIKELASAWREDADAKHAGADREAVEWSEAAKRLRVDRGGLRCLADWWLLTRVFFPECSPRHQECSPRHQVDELAQDDTWWRPLAILPAHNRNICSVCGKGAILSFEDVPFCGPCFETERERARERERIIEEGETERERIIEELSLLRLDRGGIAAPEIERFASVFLDPSRAWPPTQSPFMCPDDIEALRMILEEKGIYVPTERLVSLVRSELTAQRCEHFRRAFEQRHPLICSCSSAEDWASAYLDTFENNLGYRSLLLGMATRYGPQMDAGEAWRILALVEEKVEQRARRRRMDEILQAMSSGTTLRRMTIEDVDTMSGLEFEHFLGELFRAMGYKVQVTQASGDQGADVVVAKFGERSAVQAKRCSCAIGNSAVQEAVAAKAHYGCHQAVVATNNYFTSSARQLAASNAVALWDRDQLKALIAAHMGCDRQPSTEP